MIQHEIRQSKQILQLLAGLWTEASYSAKELFYGIDRSKRQFLDYDCLLSFISEKAISPQDQLSAMVINFMRRVNRSDSGKISLADFLQLIEWNKDEIRKLEQDKDRSGKAQSHKRAQSFNSSANFW